MKKGWREDIRLEKEGEIKEIEKVEEVKFKGERERNKKKEKVRKREKNLIKLINNVFWEFRFFI